MKHRQWTTENWKKVLWTDESKFEIVSSSHRVFVRRQVGEKMVLQYVTPTVKHGGSMMIWGSFAGSRVADLHRVTDILNQKGHHSILQHHAIPSGLCLVGQGFILRPKTSDDPSKITTQNIPPGYVRTTLDENNKTVGFKSWNGQHSLKT